MTKHLLVVASILSLVALAGRNTFAQETNFSRPLRERNPQANARRLQGQASAIAAVAGKVERDVVYGKADEVELKMDFYFPQNSGEKPLPVVMYVHGGGWRGGDKGGGAGALAIPELLKRSYLVTSINYRLSPQFKFPAHIEDAKCAVRFLRAHAKKYNLDPKRIGVWGGSAGGHLVALMGTADESAGFDKSGGWTNQSSRVQTVVDMFGPAELSGAWSRPADQLAEEVFGISTNGKDILKRASPTTYVSKDDPPFLILHGENDNLVPLKQSEILLEKLKAAGVPAKLVVVKNAGHGFGPAGGEPTPSRAEISQMIANFFDQHLQKEKLAKK